MVAHETSPDCTLADGQHRRLRPRNRPRNPRVEQRNLPALSHDGIVWLTMKGGERRPFTFSLFHQLRCFNIVRESLLARRHPPYTKPGRLATHCINYIRQIVLCRADLTLESAGHPRGPNTVVSDVTHVCRDWSVIWDEIEGNESYHRSGCIIYRSSVHRLRCMTYPRNSLTPIRGRGIVVLCPSRRRPPKRHHNQPFALQRVLTFTRGFYLRSGCLIGPKVRCYIPDETPGPGQAL